MSQSEVCVLFMSQLEPARVGDVFLPFLVDRGEGLVALLVLCLSGCTPDEISGVQPEFIKAEAVVASS